MSIRTEVFVALSSLLWLAACGEKPPAEAPPSSSAPARNAAPAATSSAEAKAASSAPAAPTQAPSGPLGRVAWLAGTWTGAKPDGTTLEEKWSAPEGSTMKGEAKASKAGKVVSTEAMSIEARPDAVVYVATPSGQPKAEFPLNEKSSTGQVALFMNLEHDWPTRIRYERVGDDLKVKVQGRPGQQVDEYTLKLAK